MFSKKNLRGQRVSHALYINPINQKQNVFVLNTLKRNLIKPKKKKLIKICTTSNFY